MNFSSTAAKEAAAGQPHAAPSPSSAGDSFAEACRGLLFRIHWPENPGLRAIGVMGCHVGQGATTIANRLANSASSFPNQKVLVVDADWQECELTRTFHAVGKTGLTDVCFGDTELEHAIFPHGGNDLYVLPVGTVRAEGLHTVTSCRWVEILDRLRHQFDLVVFDLPAATRATSQLGLASLLDGILLVLRREGIKGSDVRETKRALTESGAAVLGAVWNECCSV